MKIGILQPGFLPWLGFFEQVYQCDAFVIYDDVQYDKHGWRNRNRIKAAQGPQWLTVPVHFSLKEPQECRYVKIDNTADWRRKHLVAIRQNYSNAPFFSRHYPLFEEGLSLAWDKLIDVDMFFLRGLAKSLGLQTRNFIFSSTLKSTGDRITRLLNICKELGADTFYEGAAGRNYLDQSVFKAQGIDLIFQDYPHPEYRQQFGAFLPYLSVVDLLFNEGNDSLSILTRKKL